MIRFCLCIACCVFCAVCGCSNKEAPAPATVEKIVTSGKQAAKPAADESKSRIVRTLQDTLGELKAKGTPEEMRLVRKILRQADEELSNSLGKNARRKIIEANNKPDTFQVRRRKVISSAEKKQAGSKVKPDDQAGKKSPDRKK